MNAEQYKANADYLEKESVYLLGKAWEEKEFSAELQTSTDAGEDMIIDLEVLSKECMQEYIDGFDSNEEVMMWWRNGEAEAHKHGVPFSNVADHYKDYENFIEWLQGVCDGMPY